MGGGLVWCAMGPDHVFTHTDAKSAQGDPCKKATLRSDLHGVMQRLLHQTVALNG